MSVYYHNTFDITKKIMVKTQKMKPSTFNYMKYVDWILENVDPGDTRLVTDYPGAPRQAPYMGVGLYCYNDIELARVHDTRTNRTVANITVDSQATFLDLDADDVKDHILDQLDYFDKEYIDNNIQKDDRWFWKLVVNIIKISFYDGFYSQPENVGVMLHIFHNIYPREQYDVYQKHYLTKYDTISEKEVCYILISNNKCITSIT